MLIPQLLVFIFLCIFVADIKATKLACKSNKYLKIENCTALEKNPNEKGEWSLLILHNNDMHSRFVETDQRQNVCPAELKEKKQCYGGMARVAAVVRTAREEEQKGGVPVLFLNAGDTFAGTPWFMVHKAPLIAESLNRLQPNATSLGNHEFDLGASGLESLFNLTTGYPILAANIDVSKEPGLVNQQSLKKSYVFNVKCHKIGVIGYVLPETKFMAIANNITFTDEIQAIREEIEILKKDGVDIFIALGHSGFEMDKKIAAEVEDIDIVVGGHSNTFLWNGEKPDREKRVESYPFMVKQSKSDKEVPVVQAYAHTKYMGRLIVTFDKKGNVIKSCGQPLLLNNSVHREKDFVEFFEQYKPKVDELVNEIIGESILLNVTGCRKQECDIGNLVAQAMVEAAKNDSNPMLKISEGDKKEDAEADILSLQNAGGIRAALEPYPNGTVVYGHLMTSMPYESTLFVSKITGDQLKRALEGSVKRYEDGTKEIGEFPQLANIKVTFDVTKEENNRVVKLEVKKRNCEKNIDCYKLYDKNAVYTIIVSSFVADAGDGYTVFKESGVKSENLGILDTRMLADYIRKHTPINQDKLDKLKGHISFENYEKCCKS